MTAYVDCNASYLLGDADFLSAHSLPKRAVVALLLIALITSLAAALHGMKILDVILLWKLLSRLIFYYN